MSDVQFSNGFHIVKGQGCDLDRGQLECSSNGTTCGLAINFDGTSTGTRSTGFMPHARARPSISAE